MKNKKKGLLVIIFILIISTFGVILSKISPFTCCVCNPDSYKLYPASIVLSQYLLKLVANIDCMNCALLGCAFSYWIIPYDLILTIVILGYFYLRKK